MVDKDPINTSLIGVEKAHCLLPFTHSDLQTDEFGIEIISHKRLMLSLPKTSATSHRVTAGAVKAININTVPSLFNFVQESIVVGWPRS